MMEMVVFALVFVMAQLVVGLIMTYVTFKLMTNKKFMTKWCKKYMKIMAEVTDELI